MAPKVKRVTQACNYCKLKRIKCTGVNPCNNCQNLNIECTYSKPKKRGKKVIINIDNYFKTFVDGCNYLSRGIPFQFPIRNENSKYDILINNDLINNLFKQSTFEFLPFINPDIIKSRIFNKCLNYSLLFSLYALSELLNPYGDYNDSLKYKTISRHFLELCKIRNNTNDIQIIESFFILSLCETGNIGDYFYTSCALKTLFHYNIYDMNVPEYKKEEEGGKKHILLVYGSIIFKYIAGQIFTGFYEYTEVYDPLFESSLVTQYENNSIINSFETIKEYTEKFNKKPKCILLDQLKNDINSFDKIKINEYTGMLDLNHLLSIKYKNKDIITEIFTQSLNFNYYLNQPSKWLNVTISIFLPLRNTLFIYNNIKNKKLKFNALLFIEEEKNFTNLQENIPHEFKYTSYRTDPLNMYLYKRRIYLSYLSNRIFLRRVIIKILLNGMTSSDLVTNIKTIINPNIIDNKKLCDKNKYIYIQYNKNKFHNSYQNIDDNSHFDNNNDDDLKYIQKRKRNNSDFHESFYNHDNENSQYNKKIKFEYQNDEIINFKDGDYSQMKETKYNKYYNVQNAHNYINANVNENENGNCTSINDSYNQINIGYQNQNQYLKNKNQEKIKYWICKNSYMELDMNEMNDFMDSCIYHQILFILKNVLCKCNDFLLNNNMYYEQIAKFKEIKENKDHKTQFFESPAVFALYQLGIIYLSKFVENKGSDYYNDNIITFSTNIKHVMDKIKNDPYNNNNWYFGGKNSYYTNLNNNTNEMIKNKSDNSKEECSDKLKIENIINSDSRPLKIENNDNDSYNNSINNKSFDNNFSENYYHDDNNTENQNFNCSHICDQILDFLLSVETKDMYDLNLGKELNNYIDMFYYDNVKEKCKTCKSCLKQKYDNSKENFIEMLKLLKYYYYSEEHTPSKCYIYNFCNEIMDFKDYNISFPTYQFFYQQLKLVKPYTEIVEEISKYFRSLEEKAIHSLNQGLNSFDISIELENLFF